MKVETIGGLVQVENTLSLSLLKIQATDGFSVREARVVVDFQNGILRISNPFRRETRELQLSEYDEFDGDLLSFVKSVLSEGR